jgi:neuroligin
VVSNFGLLDQIAALHWLQENVGAFGGNPDAVTLVGHGTGASLVSFLMTSPVAKAGSQELFQKAILMSGSSLSPMSVCEDPKDITLQVRVLIIYRWGKSHKIFSVLSHPQKN